MSTPLLPDGSHIGTVHLRVADLGRQLRFYRDVLGFSILADDTTTAALGSSGAPLLVLHQAPEAPPRAPGTTGLFHVAYLLPDRVALGAMIRRVGEAGWAFQGFADHNVSEAAYLADPEGNGIELYSDRARDVWTSVDGGIFMTTEPLDVEGLLLTAPEPAAALPDGTVVGHIHLRVSTLDVAEAFYVDRLGFEVVTRRYPGALFVSAGGYHHHVGCNVWGGTHAPAPAEGALGLMSFDVVVPSEEARRRLLGTDDGDEGILLDGDRIPVRITGG